MLKKLKKANMIIYIAVLLVSVYIAYQIPYTHDDWDWGIDVGMQHLLTADINSRYVGNLFEVIMTRSILAKSVIIGVVCFVLPLMAARLASDLCGKGGGENNTCLFVVGTALLLSTSPNIMITTFNWVAGFANYVISLVFLGLFFRFILAAEKNEHTPAQYIAYGLITLAAQLFLENITIYILLVSLAALVIKREKKNVIIFAGAIAGTVIMFSSSIYSKLFTSGTAVDDYRMLVYDSESNIFAIIGMMFVNYRTNILGNVYIYSNRVCGVLVLLLMIETILRAKQTDKKKAAVLIAGDCICLICYMGVVGTRLWEKAILVNYEMNVILAVILLLTVISQIIILFSNEVKLRNVLLFLIGSTQFVVAPLAAIENGYGSRSFVTCAFMLIIAVCIILEDVLSLMAERYPERKFGMLFKTVAVLLAAIVLIPRAYIFMEIGSVDRQRYELIENCDFLVQKEIVLPEYPNNDYLWGSTPVGDVRMNYFKEFYNIPEDVSVIFEGAKE